MSLHRHDMDIFDKEANTQKRARNQTDGTKSRKIRLKKSTGGVLISQDSSFHTSAHCNVNQEDVDNKHSAIHGLIGGSNAIETIGQDASANHYMSQIANMFTRKPHDTLTTNATNARICQETDVTLVSRTWEDRFLHEPSGCERPCVNFSSRQCFAGCIKTGQISDPNLTLCEFYTPVEYEEIKASGWVWPKETKPCLLCLRCEIYSRFIETRCNANGCVENVNYATIGNIVGEPGEYVTESCFVSRPDRYEGVLHPVVIPTVYDYEIVLANGNRTLKQRLAYPEDAIPSFFF